MKQGEVNGVRWEVRDGCIFMRDGLYHPVVLLERAPNIIAALTAATATDGEGPRWPKPEGAGEWLGRVDDKTPDDRPWPCDAWVGNGGVWLNNGPDNGYPGFYDDDDDFADTDSPLARARALRDARNAKPRRVVGWRVRDSDDEHVKNEPGASFGWDWVDDDDVPPAMSRADALDLLRRCRDWARADGVGDTTFRLVRVTRRAG